jgi:hypothetical protein
LTSLFRFTAGRTPKKTSTRAITAAAISPFSSPPVGTRWFLTSLYTAHKNGTTKHFLQTCYSLYAAIGKWETRKRLSPVASSFYDLVEQSGGVLRMSGVRNFLELHNKPGPANGVAERGMDFVDYLVTTFAVQENQNLLANPSIPSVLPSAAGAEYDLPAYTRFEAEYHCLLEAIACLCGLKLLGLAEHQNLLVVLRSMEAMRLLPGAKASFRSKQEEGVWLDSINAALSRDVALPAWVFGPEPCEPQGRDDRDPKKTLTREQTIVALDALTSLGLPRDIRNLTPEQMESLLSPAVKQWMAVLRNQSGQLQNAGPVGCDCTDQCKNSPCLAQSPCCMPLRHYVADLMTVRETLTGYVPVDVAYVENVMPGEKFVRTHRNEVETELTTEIENETNSKEQRDRETTDKFELQTEVSRTLDKNWSLDAGVKGTVSGWEINADGHYGGSSSASDKTSRSFAHDVVERSVSSMEKRNRELSKARILHKVLDKTVHSFESPDKDARVGVFHWVRQDSRMQVMSHGRRMMYDFVVPEPASLYKHFQKLASANLEAFTATIPTPPDPLPVTRAIDIIATSTSSSQGWTKLSAAYYLSGTKPPPESKIEIVFGCEIRYGTDPTNTVCDVKIPEGYRATGVSIVAEGYKGGSGTAGSVAPPKQIQYVVGTHSDSMAANGDTIAPSGLLSVNVVGPSNLSLAFALDKKDSAVIAGTIYCDRTIEHLLSWKSELFERLQAAHKKQVEVFDDSLQKYNDLKAAFSTQQKEEIEGKIRSIDGRNPYFNREIERTELKRIIISLMSCQHFDTFNAMRPKVAPCGYPQPDPHDTYEQGKVIRFWEQAIDWNAMGYLFYPYFWSPKCSWPEKADTDSSDPLFDKFLAAGAARVQVPVRPGFESMMVFYERTQMIWGQDGEPPIDPSNPAWVSIVDEIRHQQLCDLDDRPGKITSASVGDLVIQVSGALEYTHLDSVSLNWVLDEDAMDKDIDREISIDTVIYRIVAIENIGMQPFADRKGWMWQFTLNRKYEGPSIVGGSNLPYSVGARFVGAPWSVSRPTELLWLNNPNIQLPSYPL